MTLDAGSSRPQVVFAFDFGARRIGVASGDTLTRTTRALTTLDYAGELPWPGIEKLISEYQPAQFVVGLPLHMDGKPTATTEPSRAFARKLKARFGKPVALIDERLSSREAEAQLRHARATGAKRRKVTHADIDMIAACILLERWFSDPGGGDAV